MEDLPGNVPESLRRFIASGQAVIDGGDGPWELRLRPPDFSHPLTEGALLIAKNPCGDCLFLRPDPMVANQFAPQVLVCWHEGPEVEVYAEDLETLLFPPPATPSQRPPVLYSDGTPVMLGDQVIVRGWFRTRPGSVNYIPGISPKDSEMEHHGLCWVGIQPDRGAHLGLVVDPETSRLIDGVRFIARGKTKASR